MMKFIITDIYVLIRKTGLKVNMYIVKRMILNLLFSILIFLKLSISQELCGIATKSPTNRTYFPWIAEIYSIVNVTKDGNPQHLCGSTIITSSFAVTAGHCIQEKHSSYKRQPNEIFLLANILDLNRANESYKIVLQNILTHHDWNPYHESFDGDVALLHFKDSLKFSKYISPICLWNDNIVNADYGKILTFIALDEDDPGYYNYDFSESHNYPKEFNMPIRDNCIESQPRFIPIASNRTYCAGGFNSGPCLETGNSGSSMSVEINQIFYLRGLVSASFIDIAGCDNYTFTLFTDLLKYKDWINEKIQLS